MINLETIAKELQTGVEGLQTFIDNFAGHEIFDADQWTMLDIILAKADGYAAGLNTLHTLHELAEKPDEQPAAEAAPKPEPAPIVTPAPKAQAAAAPAKPVAKAPSKDWPTLLLYHCSQCGFDHWCKIDGDTADVRCNCGRSETVRRSDLTPIEYACSECGRYTYGLTNRGEDMFDVKCKCGTPVPVEYSYRHKRYKGMQG